MDENFHVAVAYYSSMVAAIITVFVIRLKIRHKTYVIAIDGATSVFVGVMIFFFLKENALIGFVYALGVFFFVEGIKDFKHFFSELFRKRKL